MTCKVPTTTSRTTTRRRLRIHRFLWWDNPGGKAFPSASCDNDTSDDHKNWFNIIWCSHGPYSAILCCTRSTACFWCIFRQPVLWQSCNPHRPSALSVTLTTATNVPFSVGLGGPPVSRRPRSRPLKSDVIYPKVPGMPALSTPLWKAVSTPIQHDNGPSCCRCSRLLSMANHPYQSCEMFQKFVSLEL